MDVRVALVDDDSRYRASLEMLFELTPGFVLVDSFPDAADVVAAAQACTDAECPWDIVVMDLQMPRMHGVQGTGLLKGCFPELPVLVLTVFEDPPTILQAICAGADGYLLKRSPPDVLIAGMHSALSGGSPLTPGVASTVLQLVRRTGPAPADRPLQLSERESQVLACLVEGLSYKQVAGELEISIDTVRTHIRRLYKKLRVHSVAEAVSRAVREGIVQ